MPQPRPDEPNAILEVESSNLLKHVSLRWEPHDSPVRAALEAHDRDKIRSLHLGADELAGGGIRAHQVGRRQRRHVEVQDHEPPIAIPNVAIRRGRDPSFCDRRGGRR